MKNFVRLGGAALSTAFLSVAISSAASADVVPVAPAPAPMAPSMATAPRVPHERARVSTPTLLPRLTALRRFTAEPSLPAALEPQEWQPGWDPYYEAQTARQLQIEPELAREAYEAEVEEAELASETFRLFLPPEFERSLNVSVLRQMFAPPR
ncbi:hypothetical protein GCM10023074_06570 [Microbispora amethystogenes]|uniref:Uncharacterized protein n=1 Tax=Microbispora amethystogenes TaxID=1427754 RepID=A0ABQ4F6F9_9ACTN|nr:hypothetical protein Mam01_05440 [Microbispora amethystogenes]